jgi:hypothetical protein
MPEQPGTGGEGEGDLPPEYTALARQRQPFDQQPDSASNVQAQVQEQKQGEQDKLRQHQMEQLHAASDSGWNENDHPRADNGQFGKGAGSGAVHLKGDELGQWSSMKELRQKAMQYAENNFIGKRFSNESTGNEIQVPKSGVKHTIAGSSDALLRTIPAIPSLIQKAVMTNSESEKGGDPNIQAVETYEATVEIDEKEHRAIMTVKLYRDGRRYYDHGLVQ